MPRQHRGGELIGRCPAFKQIGLTAVLLCWVCLCLSASAADWPGERYQPPNESNPHYYTDNPYHQKNYGLPNCTAYAWGRISELTGTAPGLNPGGDAKYWFRYTPDGYRRGLQPRLGAVACWVFEGTGHVAVVESIQDEHIVISQSHWSARKPGSDTPAFSRLTIKADGSDYLPGFQGYIYACDFDLPQAAVLADRSELMPPADSTSDAPASGGDPQPLDAGQVAAGQPQGGQ